MLTVQGGGEDVPRVGVGQRQGERAGGAAEALEALRLTAAWHPPHLSGMDERMMDRSRTGTSLHA